jgi:hypothetical protein
MLMIERALQPGCRNESEADRHRVASPGELMHLRFLEGLAFGAVPRETHRFNNLILTDSSQSA